MRCAPRRTTPAFTLPRRLGLSICVGAALTVALSGPAAVLDERLRPSAERNALGELHADAFGFIGASDISQTHRLFDDRWSVTYFFGCQLRREIIPRWEIEPPPWVQRREELGDSEVATHIGAGFPFRAFCATERLLLESAGPRLSLVYSGGWKIGDLSRGIRQRPLIVPYSPIWPGLLANLAIWSTAAGLAVASRSHLRDMIRRRRSLCTACAYSREGLDDAAPCPECGHTR